MERYTSNAGYLCLTAIKAIKDRAIEAGEDPITSLSAKRAAYVPVWLWNHATERAKVQQGQASGVVTSQAVSREADIWASCIHRKYLTNDTAGVMTPPRQEPAVVKATEAMGGAEVWANLANALALQATATARSAATTTKNGLKPFRLPRSRWYCSHRQGMRQGG